MLVKNKLSAVPDTVYEERFSAVEEHADLLVSTSHYVVLEFCL